MGSVHRAVQELIQESKRADGGAQYVGTASLQERTGAYYGNVPVEFIDHEGIEKGSKIERYVDWDARAVVMFFPEPDSDGGDLNGK